MKIVQCYDSTTSDFDRIKAVSHLPLTRVEIWAQYQDVYNLINQIRLGSNQIRTIFLPRAPISTIKKKKLFKIEKVIRNKFAPPYYVCICFNYGVRSQFKPSDLLQNLSHYKSPNIDIYIYI